VPDRPGGETLGALCGEIVALTHRHWGKGPTKCRASWAGSDALLVLLADGFTSAEQTVSAAGREADVMAFRTAYHEAMNHRMIELVERLTGRKVLAALNASHVDPDLTALVFVMEHEGPA
jgi:uncharacterized protein YbcI